MNLLFSKLGSSIHKNPFKSLFISIIIIVAMIVGATNIQMSTGNETLVQPDNPIFISTKKMESTFGGDSLLVLIESSEEVNLLNVENMRLLYDIQQRLSYENDIFSIMSPATIVHQASEKQKEMLVENVESMSDGLAKMGDSIQEIGKMLAALDPIDSDEMLNKLNDLSEVTNKFDQLSKGQIKLADGLGVFETNLKQASTGLESLTNQLEQMALKVPKEQADMLGFISEQLKNTSLGLSTMGGHYAPMIDGALSTSQALDSIGDKLSSELSNISNNFSKSISPDQLNEMSDGFLKMGEQLNQLSSGLKTISDKSPMMTATIVSTQAELEQILYNEDHTLKSMFNDVVINKNQIMMIVKLKGNLEDSRKDELTKIVFETFEEIEFQDAEVTLSGKSVLDLSLKSEMRSSMKVMVALAILIMFIVLGLIFRVKWRMLSLGVIFVCVIATLGLMGWIGVPITMVSMAVFPILIGLGIDYSIQFHNRFEEEDDIEQTSKHIGKAVFIAVIATMLGFISLFASPVPMIQDFGKMLTIGVFVSFLGSLFLLLPTLRAAQFVQNKGKSDKFRSKKNDHSFAQRILSKGASMTIRFRYLILIAFVVVAGYGMSVDSKIQVETNIETFMPQDLQALYDIRNIRSAIGSTDQIVIYFEDDNVMSEENFSYIKNKADVFKRSYPDQVQDVKSFNQLIENGAGSNELGVDKEIDFINNLPNSQRKLFIGEDNQEAIMIVQIKPLPIQELEELIDDLKKELSDSDMKVSLTGKSMLDVEMVDGLTSGRISMTLIGLGLVFMALLILYRNIITAILPIIPVALIIGTSSAVMYVLNIEWTPITATLGALVLGMGTEMTVMMMERYLEDRHNGNSKIEAVRQSSAKIGKAILASGLTTIGGFSVMLFSSFVILQDFGVMTMINISLALISTFVVFPPLLYIFDSLMVKKRNQ